MEKTIFKVMVAGCIVNSGEPDAPNGDYHPLSDEYGRDTFAVLFEAEALYKREKETDEGLRLIPEDYKYLYGNETVEIVAFLRLKYDKNGDLEDLTILEEYTRTKDPKTT